MGSLKKLTSLPFVKGFALQNYSQAETGIIEAFKAGYQYWYIDGSLTSEMPKNWNSVRIKSMVSMMEQYNLHPIFHGNYKVPLSSDVDEIRQAAVQYTKKEINLASELSAPLIIHGGVIVEPRLVKAVKREALQNFMLSIEELSNYAMQKNVVLYLENLSNYQNYRPFHYIFTTEEEFNYILSATNADFFLDMGHANIGNDSPKRIFEKYYQRIVGMSLSNNNGQHDQHLSLKNGTINYSEILIAIRITGWNGIVAFETRDASPEKSIADLVSIYTNCYSTKSAQPLCYKTDVN